MKKTLTTIISLLLASTAAVAQENTTTLRVYRSGEVSWERSTAQMDSIKFDGSNALFHYNASGVKVKSIGSIDSVVFASEGSSSLSSDTVAIGTDSVVRITYGAATVAVDNPFAASGVSVVVDGTDVAVTATANRADITYWVSGACTSGSLLIQTDRKLIVVLDGLQLTNPSGPALKITGDKRAALHLMGESTLADGTASGGKGAVQSDGRFEIQGSGTLNIYGYAKHGLQSSGATSMLGGTVNILAAAKDGMNVDDFVMYAGSISVSGTGSDCIDADQGYIYIAGGTLDLAAAEDGAKGLACDSTLTIAGGTIGIALSGTDTKGLRAGMTMSIVGGEVNISMTGSSSVYTDTDGTLDSYKPVAIKAKADFRWTGGNIGIATTGHGLSADGSIALAATPADSLTIASTGTGFTYSGSGTSATDGFAPACIKSDADINIQGGTITTTATGKGGRGLVADGRLTVGTVGDADSLIHLGVKTSGDPVNVTSSGGGWGGWGSSTDYWKGLPKGIKIQDNITINSGIVQSHCAQTGSSSGGGWGGGGSRTSNGEAIESKDSIIINGGIVETNAYDDAINAGTYMEVNGGQVWAYSRGNDAIDCNGTVMRFNGGLIVVDGNECGIDNNQEQNGVLYVSGATMVVVPGSMGAVESTCTTTGQKKLQLSTGGGWGGGSSAYSATSGFAIYSSSSQFVLAFKQPTVSGSGFLFATGGAKPGSSYILVTSPDIQSGSYKVFKSPTVGGDAFHGLYQDENNVSTTGTASNVSAQ